MIIRSIGRIALPPWFDVALVSCTLFIVVTLTALSSPPDQPHLNVAFIGNSMMYYNDLPRFLQALSDGHLTQNSCLHPNTNFESIIMRGNGMYDIWNTSNALIHGDGNYTELYDFGACTVTQLLFGYDETLDASVQAAQGNQYDDKYITDDDDSDDDTTISDDYFKFDGGLNPCFESSTYYSYLNNTFQDKGAPEYDFIVLNDSTNSPASYYRRRNRLTVLREIYLPWFLETGATPVFLSTYGYDSPKRSDTVPTFTLRTYEGYEEYVRLLSGYLPASQQPRIAPVGLAFLIVWEENRSLWQRMLYDDDKHPSPIGTFLQGLIVYHAMFGRLPKSDIAIRTNMKTLWSDARCFSHGGDQSRAVFPTQEEAAYLYSVAGRLMDHGYKPQNLVASNQERGVG